MKKLFTALLAVLIIASMMAGCAAAGSNAEDSAQTRHKKPISGTTEDVTEATEEGTDLTEDETEATEEGTDLTEDETEATEEGTDPTEETGEPETAILTVDQVDALTLTAKLSSETGKETTVTFCQKKDSDSLTYFYVCTKDDAERTEYLYHINGEKLTQYLRVNNGVIRNSDVHSEEMIQVYQEQQELFQTFVNAQTVLNPDTFQETKLHPELLLHSISMGEDEAITVTEDDVVYYELGEKDGYAGIHRDTNALVILVDSEIKPMMSVTELSLNDATAMDALLNKADSAPLLAPEISFHEELDAFRVDCLIYETAAKTGEQTGKPLSLTMMRTADDLIVYGIETELDSEAVSLIYEIAADGSVTEYRRTEETGTYQNTTTPNAKNEMKQQLELAAIFTDYASLLAGCQYESTDIFSVDDGDIVYQIKNKNNLKGYIAIDSATGILKGLFNEEGQPLLIVQALETENVVLDAYR